MKQQEAWANCSICSFKRLALGKVSNLKRVRESEYKHCLTKINCCSKRVRVAYNEVRQGVWEAADIVRKWKGEGKVRCGAKGRPHQIKEFCRGRRERVRGLLNEQVHPS